MEFARGFLRKASHSTKIYQTTRKRPTQGGTAWFTRTSNKQWKYLYLVPPWWHWYSSNTHQIDHANFQSIVLILEMVANESEYGLIKQEFRRVWFKEKLTKILEQKPWKLVNLRFCVIQSYLIYVLHCVK